MPPPAFWSVIRCTAGMRSLVDVDARRRDFDGARGRELERFTLDLERLGFNCDLLRALLVPLVARDRDGAVTPNDDFGARIVVDGDVAALELGEPIAPVVDGEDAAVVPAAAEDKQHRLGALERHGRKPVLLESLDAVLDLVGEELELHLLEFFLVIDERHAAARRRHGDAAGELVRAAHRKIPPAFSTTALIEPPAHMFDPPPGPPPPPAPPPGPPSPRVPNASGSVSSSAVVEPPASLRNSTPAMRSS